MTTQWEALEKRLDNVKKPISTLALCDDPDIRAAYLTAKRAAERADDYLKALPEDADSRDLAAKQAKEAKAALDKARKAYDEHTVVLRFTALERRELEALQNQHPADEEDEAKGNDFAFDTFAPALISAASLDGMPVEAAARYLNSWTAADSFALWQAAWSIQHTQRTDLGKG
jgi:hypothetical protein